MFDWNRCLEIGISEIDMQHRTLVHLLAKLFNAMQSGAGKQMINEVLKELETYSQDHFATEKVLMDDIDYPEKKGHVAAHAIFENKIKTLRQEHQENNQGLLSIQVLLFLRNWLNEHIAKTDKALGDYLLQKDAS